ncbi:MAG: hypothetical protein K5636_01095 [Bacteroidales bacterium]|nr:hypothetical protein [Bacteroidales bacterium]
MIYRYTDGETVSAEPARLEDLLALNDDYVQNYLEVFDDLDDPAYVARGNGFCDTKYSEDFIESQMAKYRQRVEDVRRWIQLRDQK